MYKSSVRWAAHFQPGGVDQAQTARVRFRHFFRSAVFSRVIHNLRGFYVQSTSFGGAGCKLVAHASLSSNGQELGWRWSALETLLCRGRLRFCRAHVTLQDVILLPWELRSTHLATRTFVVSVMQGVPLDQDLG